MLEQKRLKRPSSATSKQYLEELFRDPDFRNIMALVTREVIRRCHVNQPAAQRIVLSAIGEPKTVTGLWSRSKTKGELGLVKVIIRRRVIDWLDKETWPEDRITLPPIDGDLRVDKHAGV